MRPIILWEGGHVGFVVQRRGKKRETTFDIFASLEQQAKLVRLLISYERLSFPPAGVILGGYNSWKWAGGEFRAPDVLNAPNSTGNRRGEGNGEKLTDEQRSTIAWT